MDTKLLSKLPYDILPIILSYHENHKITINNKSELFKIFYKFKNHYQLYQKSHQTLKFTH
jgi:hypothetical protein